MVEPYTFDYGKGVVDEIIETAAKADLKVDFIKLDLGLPVAEALIPVNLRH